MCDGHAPRSWPFSHQNKRDVLAPAAGFSRTSTHLSFARIPSSLQGFNCARTHENLWNGRSNHIGPRICHLRSVPGTGIPVPAHTASQKLKLAREPSCSAQGVAFSLDARRVALFRLQSRRAGSQRDGVHAGRPPGGLVNSPSADDGPTPTCRARGAFTSMAIRATHTIHAWVQS